MPCHHLPPPSHSCQLPTRQHTRQLPFRQVGSQLPTTLAPPQETLSHPPLCQGHRIRKLRARPMTRPPAGLTEPEGKHSQFMRHQSPSSRSAREVLQSRRANGTTIPRVGSSCQSVTPLQLLPPCPTSNKTRSERLPRTRTLTHLLLRITS